MKNINIEIAATNIIVTEDTTLKELLEVIDTVDDVENPTKALHEKMNEDNVEEQIKLLAETQDGDCKVNVNSYAVYSNGTDTAVLQFPDCCNLTYHFDQLKDNVNDYLAQQSTIGDGMLEIQPRFTAKMLLVKHQLETNGINSQYDWKDTTKKLIASEVKSSQENFAVIALDELISFESLLYDDNIFAIEHPVGKKIYKIIKGWNNFINFDDITYYHARRIEKGKKPFLDQEMLKAPLNISSHGRYNAIGKSCYYISETKEGAVAEIKKHSGGAKSDIQVIGLKSVKSAKIIDLSGEVNGTNRFIEHLRFTADNEDGKIIKEYLLPNFVASCCKKIGIDGIKYKSTEYNCYVLWKDDYFEFVDGSREIIAGSYRL